MTESLPTSLQVPPLSFENLRTRTLKELMADDSLTPRQLVRTMRREKRMKALQYFDPADDGDDEFVDEEEDEHELSSRQVKELVAIFNEDAKKGLKRFWEAGLVGQSAIDVANFFLDNERLSRVQIGIFIGDDDPFSQQVLRCFVAQFSFDGLELDDALRIFFVSFVLPSESQIIERILEAFSEHYAFCNCDTPLKDADTAMALAFALIMLNTDLHNPEIKTKMTREQFVSNFDGVEERRRLPKAVLTHAYDRIKQKELKLTPETSDHLTLFLRSDHQGWLSKLGGRQKTQKRRWFILKSNVLFYFKDPQDRIPNGTIPLEDIHIRRTARPNSFEIFSDTHPIKSTKRTNSGLLVSGRHKRYVFIADSEEECGKWISRIQQSIHQSEGDSPPERTLAVSTSDLFDDSESNEDR